VRHQAAVCLLLALLSFTAARAATPPASPTPAPAQAAPAGPLPLSAFYDKAALHGAKLSPNGQYVATVITRAEGSAVYVYDLKTDKGDVVLNTGSPDGAIDWVAWKGDDRLVMGVTFLHIDRWGKQPDGEVRSWRYGKFLMAVDRDGKNRVNLLRDDKHTSSHIGGSFIYLMDTLKKDPDHIIAWAPTFTGEQALWLTDIHTGAAQEIEHGDDNVVGWGIDSDGKVVARMRERFRAIVFEGRAPGETKWSEIVRIRDKDITTEVSEFEFMGPGPEAGTLYVAVKPKDAKEGAARTIRLYDFRSHTLGPSLWRPLDYDIVGIVRSSDSEAMTGVCYWSDTYVCEFKDAESGRIFRGLSKFFNNDRNIEPVSYSDDNHFWLLKVTGPEEPGTYYLYNNVKHSVFPLGITRPSLPSGQLGTMERFVTTGRDGTRLPGYLTTPPGTPSGPLPLIVLPHGGPEARDYFDFDLLTQFLATRGYAVLQVNYRGSAGYGLAWAEAGYHQWNERMQDDVDDAVSALIATGRVDRKRVCAVGVSYGGYAALMAGARHPELYKCVVSWAGIADLPKFLSWEHSESGDDPTRYAYWVKAIGDPKTDGDKLIKASPTSYAEGYGPPVLLLHGEDDPIVSPDQSKLMEKALKKAGRDVRLILVKGEDHPDWSDYHMQNALTEIEAFLKAHIAPAAMTTPAAAPATPAAKPAA
jgi:dipeptidyl aminopeptidase/acylaminoacyl peptidase